MTNSCDCRLWCGALVTPRFHYHLVVGQQKPSLNINMNGLMYWLDWSPIRRQRFLESSRNIIGILIYNSASSMVSLRNGVLPDTCLLVRLSGWLGKVDDSWPLRSILNSVHHPAYGSDYQKASLLPVPVSLTRRGLIRYNSTLSSKKGD